MYAGSTFNATAALASSPFMPLLERDAGGSCEHEPNKLVPSNTRAASNTAADALMNPLKESLLHFRSLCFFITITFHKLKKREVVCKKLVTLR